MVFSPAQRTIPLVVSVLRERSICSLPALRAMQDSEAWAVGVLLAGFGEGFILPAESTEKLEVL